MKDPYPSSHPSSPTNHLHVIGTIDGGIINCPSNLPTKNRKVVLSTASLMDLSDDEISDDEVSEEAEETFGVLKAGVEHRITRVLAEGCLHKKGTGNDFFGSRGWKARYCRLALAKVEGFSVDVPLLLFYWFHYSESPSTIITLDSTVCMSIDGSDGSAWDAHCFEIIHAKGDSKEITRTFTLPRKGRDAWVYAINQALYNYEKEKSRFESSTKRIAGSTKRYRTSPMTSEIWSGDKFMEVSAGKPNVPIPVSPRSLERRPLPRPDVLAGESFL